MRLVFCEKLFVTSCMWGVVLRQVVCDKLIATSGLWQADCVKWFATSRFQQGICDKRYEPNLATSCMLRFDRQGLFTTSCLGRVVCGEWYETNDMRRVSWDELHPKICVRRVVCDAFFATSCSRRVVWDKLHVRSCLRQIISEGLFATSGRWWKECD